MAITPVGGSNFQTSSATTSSHFNYYPTTAGNFIVFFVEFSAAVTGLTLVDYNSLTTLQRGPTVNNMTCFYGVSKSSSSYYWNFDWTGSAYMGATVEEYSGPITGVGVTATASGSSGTASISLTTDGASGNTIVVGFGNSSNNAFTASVGTERQQSTSYTARCESLDNSNGSPGSLTCTSTLTSSAWDAIALELQYIVGPVLNSGVVQPRSAGQGSNSEFTALALGNNPAVPLYLPYGQTWPRG